MDEPCSPWADGTTAPCIGEDGLTEAQAVAGVALASYLLWNITDRRWNGACTDTMRPGPDCCCSPSGCCGRHVALAGTPATAVTEVTIDGLVVPETVYQLVDGATVVWLEDQEFTTPRGSYRTWPSSNRLTRPADAEGTWTIAYEWGTPPPDVWAQAALDLGCNLALAGIGSSACRLPKGTTSVNRQGITVQVDRVAQLVKDGLTGVASVDRLVTALRRGDGHRPAQAWLPGRRPRNHRLP
jgi:hypothetical protein